MTTAAAPTTPNDMRDGGPGRAGAARRPNSPPPPILPFVPQTPDALPFEVQRLDCGHPLHRMGLHAHSFFELLFVEHGGGVHRVGADAHATEPGSLFLIPPGELHDCNALGPAFAGWLLLFTREALEGAAAHAGPLPWPSCHPLLSPFLALGHAGRRCGPVPPLERPRWSERFQVMRREIEDRAPGYRFGLQAHVSLVLLDVLRLVGPSIADVETLAHDRVLRGAFDFIDRCYARPISAQDVARAVGRSVAHLTTTMRRRTGLTAGAWIAERRMTEARRLLGGTGLDLAAVADRTGYSGADSFARAFQRAHGLAPAAWRQARRGPRPDA